MKKILFAFLTIISFSKTNAQIIAVSTKYISPNDGLLGINFLFPYSKKSTASAYEGFLYGAEYSISVVGSNKTFRGLKLSPIAYQHNIFQSTKKPFAFFLGADAGYLFNSGVGKNGIVVSPYLKILKTKNNVFSLKSGYEYNTADGKQQFYLQANFDLAVWFVNEFSSGY